MTTNGRLLISCPDKKGIVAAVSKFLFDRGANLVHADQHTDPAEGTFFMRVEWEADTSLAQIDAEFRTVATEYAMDYRFASATDRRKVTIFVSKESHCLLELLWHFQADDFNADIGAVVANHPDLGKLVEPIGIPFHHLPISGETKPDVEKRQMAIAEGSDLIILAKYMQVLSPEFVATWDRKVINIHHSFLPAFIGANPYRQAHERGVKLIGATAHYVTADLDGGPIIEQDVHRVDHRHGVPELRKLGRHVERTVLARAVNWHLEDRVIVHGAKTVVFV
jgi:formyltetrahydrofolate deformylase